MDISISYGGAAFAGILSFFSPCVLPLVPFYLCYLAGISMEEFKKVYFSNYSLDFWLNKGFSKEEILECNKDPDTLVRLIQKKIDA